MWPWSVPDTVTEVCAGPTEAQMGTLGGLTWTGVIERLTEDEPKIWVHVMSKTVRQERGLRRRHFLRGNRKHGACRRGHPN